jgi:site-specific recombinase XerD
MKLDAKTVASLDLGSKRDVIYFDDKCTGFGYRLRLSSDGSKVLKTWIVQYRRGPATRRLRLGSADEISAAQAREKAEKIVAQVRLGGDPQGERSDRRDKDTLTFRFVTREYLQAKHDEVRPATRRLQALYLCGAYFSQLHGVPIDQITRKDVAAQLLAIARKHSKATAGAARSALHAFFLWCVQMGLCEHNPVAGTPRSNPAPARKRVLTDPELVAVWKACSELGDFGKIIRLLFLMPNRRREIGGMAWSEFAPDLSTWILPEARAKNHHEQTLPLLATARSIIESIPKRAGRDLLFGERSAVGFNDWHAAKHLLDEKSGVSDWTIHDIRRSLTTKMADIGVEPHVLEEILNHRSGHRSGSHGRYNHSPYKNQVHSALAQWQDHLRTLVEGGERKVLNLPPTTAA